MPDDLNAVSDEERQAAMNSLDDEMRPVNWPCRAVLDALCLARRRERALREAIEAAKRDCPACDGTGTLVSQNSEINGCGCGQCADFDRALDATDSAKGER